MLRELDLLPSRETIRIRHIRDYAVMAACDAQRIVRSRCHEPVARIAQRVATQKASLSRRSKRQPAIIVRRLQGGHGRLLGQVGQSVPTLTAHPVFEIENVAAGLAFEKLHACLRTGRWSEIERTALRAPLPERGPV